MYENAAIKKELGIEEADVDFVKRSWDREVGTPIGVTEPMPDGYQDKFNWATKFSPEARNEISIEARKRALKDLEEYGNQITPEERSAFLSRSENIRAVELMRDAHDFKLRVADLDPDQNSFERVHAQELKNSPFAENLQEMQNLGDFEDFESRLDENAKYAKASVPQGAWEFDFVPEVRDNAFINDLLKDFGVPVGVKTKEAFQNANQAVNKIYSKIKPSNGFIKNDATGWDIHISKDEIKKFIKMKPKSAWGVLYSLPEFVKRAKYDGMLPDRRGRDNIAYHRFFANADAGKGEIPVVISVREILSKDGFKKYYDLSLVEKKRESQYAKEGISRPGISSKGSLDFSQSENFSENQEKNEKFSKEVAETGGKAPANPTVSRDMPNPKYALPLGEMPQGHRRAPLVFKPILKPDLPLPNRVQEGGIAGVGEIRRWAAEALGINVNLEADAGADYLGIYTTPKDTVNLRKDSINSLEVLFHEIGHSLEKRFFNDYFSDNPGHPVSKELYKYFENHGNSSGYDKSDYVSEGFAEFVKEFILNQSGVAKKFPKTIRYVSAAFENNKGLSEVLDKIKKMVKDHQNASPAERAKARIQSSDAEETKVFLRERPLQIYNYITEKFADKSARLSDLQRIVNKLAGEGSADFDTLRRAIVQGGGQGQTEFSLWEKQLDLKGRVVGKSLADILNPVADRKADFSLFLISRRMVNLMRQNKLLKDGVYRKEANAFCVQKSGFTLNEILEFYDSADMKFRTAAALLDKFQANNLQLLADGGLISRESAKKMSKNFGYVPFRRLMEFSNSEAGLSANSNSMPIRKMRGSDREIIDPLETIMENAYIFRMIASKNLVKLGLCSSVSRLGGSGRILERQVEKVEGTEVQRRDFARAVVDSGLADDVIASDGVSLQKYYSMDRGEKIDYIAEKISAGNPLFKFMLWKNAVYPDPKNRVITTFDGGKREAWKINDAGVYDALTSLDETTGRLANSFFNSIANASKKINNITRTGATANLAFGLRNFARDQFTAANFTKSQKGFIPFLTTLYRGVIPAIVSYRRRRLLPRVKIPKCTNLVSSVYDALASLE